MRVIKSLEDVQVAIRELYGFFDKLNSKDIDMSKRRVVNASPSKDPYDYVVRKELTDRFGDVESKKIGKGDVVPVSPTGVYTLVFCNNGYPKAKNPAAPYYIIKRKSRLTCINYIAESGPLSGNTGVLNLYNNGSLINDGDILIPSGYTPGSILTFSNFLITEFEVEDVVSLEIVTSAGIYNVTVELFFEEL